MSLTSIKIKTISAFEIANKMAAGETQSAVAALNSIIPSAAFPLDQMFSLKESLQTTIEGLSVSDAIGLSSLTASLETASSADISTILFQSGVNPDTFSVENFNLDLSSLTDFQSSAMGIAANLNGGCDALLELESLATGAGDLFGDLDLNLDLDLDLDLDVGKIIKPISEYMEELAKSVEDAAGAVAEQFDQLASVKFDSIAGQIGSAAEAVVGAIANDVGSIISDVQSLAAFDSGSVDISGFLESLDLEAKAITAAFESSIENILGSVQPDLSALKDSVSNCFQHTKKVNEATLKNVEASIKDLGEGLPEVSEGALIAIQNKLLQTTGEVKALFTDDNKNITKALSAAITKSMHSNNPNASPKKILATTAKIIASGARKQDEKLNKAVGEIKAIVKAVPSFVSGADRKALMDASARAIPDRTDRNSQAQTHNTKNSIYPEEYFGLSDFAKHNSAKITSLHPIVRDRVANAVRSFVLEYKEKGIDIKIISATRTVEKQKQLRKINSLAAKNSWHSYGAAIDINVYKNSKNKPVWNYNAEGNRTTPNSGNIKQYYTGIARLHFAKHDMLNKLDGTWGNSKTMDPNHFMPVECWGLSPATPTLGLKAGAGEDNGLAKLLTRKPIKPLDLSSNTEKNNSEKAKRKAEKFYGKSLTDKEWNFLVRATVAESSSNPQEQAQIAGVILNRARTGGWYGGNVVAVLEKDWQFQAVTGVDAFPKIKGFQGTGPHDNFTTPSRNTINKAIEAISKNIPTSDKKFLNFASNSLNAYGEGTNPGFREQVSNSPNSKVIGGTIFGTVKP